MNILAFETASSHASLALLRSDGVLCEKNLQGSQSGHSEQILPLLRRLLIEAETPMQNLDALAFGSGPGAFTGVRLACALAQGFGIGLDKPVLPVCSLAALALAVDSDAQTAARQQIVVAVDARMGELYCAFYARQHDADGRTDEIETLVEPQCLPPQALALPAGEWLGAGSAFAVHEQALAPVRARLLHCEPQRVATAAAVATLAKAQLQRGHAPMAEAAEPLYVRNKVAQTTAERLAAGGRA